MHSFFSLRDIYHTGACVNHVFIHVCFLLFIQLRCIHLINFFFFSNFFFCAGVPKVTWDSAASTRIWKVPISVSFAELIIFKIHLIIFIDLFAALREKILLERASIAGGATVAVILVVILSIIFYSYVRQRRKELRLRYIHHLLILIPLPTHPCSSVA